MTDISKQLGWYGRFLLWAGNLVWGECPRCHFRGTWTISDSALVFCKVCDGLHPKALKWATGKR
jgi:hypothetical protein